MIILNDIESLVNWRKSINNSISFIPTMGNLHDGHLSLIDKGESLAKNTIVSIFVNPIQFDKKDDFDSYPRTLKEDIEKLKNKNIDALFIPKFENIFPNGKQNYFIDIGTIQHELCGEYRPGHFRGVATIIAKFFNLIKPNYAIFGKKDYQQLIAIKNLVKELNYNINIIGADIIRNNDGLALSSRNSRLSNTEIIKSTELFKILNEIKDFIINNGILEINNFIRQKINYLNNQGWKMDYIEVRNSDNLDKITKEDKNLIILGAGYLGKTRLIDNIECKL